MNFWQELLKTAIVGTERQKLKVTPPDNQLGEVLKNLDSNDNEAYLLSVAGTISLYQKAGKLPVKNKQSQLKPCEQNDLPCCTQLAEHHLSMMLAGEYVDILPEWLRLANKLGVRVPFKYLPDLLTLGKKKQELRNLILPVLGKRGLWLAAQNPEWNYVVGENDQKTWETGSLEARQLLLRKLRLEKPKQALELLEKSWKKANAQEKATLLPVLEAGLSINDQQFLEFLLDDRRKQVRDIAANLLLQLPDSDLVQRMIERVRPLISLSAKAIEIKLPENCDREMTRDGIDQSRYNSGLGEKASLLLQMLSCVPPSFWCNTWGKTPRELVKIASYNQWKKVLLEGWAVAAIRNKDDSWAIALLEVSEQFQFGSVGVPMSKDALLKILPPEKAQSFVLDLLLEHKSKVFNQKHPAYGLLKNSNYAWNQEISDLILAILIDSIKSNQNKSDWNLRSALQEFALYMEPSLVEKGTSLLSELKENPFWRDCIDDFLAKLHFRNEMQEALRSQESGVMSNE